VRSLGGLGAAVVEDGNNLSHGQVRQKGAVSAQELGQLQPFLAVLSQECTGQLSSFGPT
jgi:hypothetical protein